MALRNVFGELGLNQTLKEIQYLLTALVAKTGQNDGVGRMYVTGPVTQSGTWTVNANATQTGTWNVNASQVGTWNYAQGTPAANTAPWPVSIQSHGGIGLDLHYQSMQAMDGIRSRITVS